MRQKTRSIRHFTIQFFVCVLCHWCNLSLTQLNSTETKCSFTHSFYWLRYVGQENCCLYIYNVDVDSVMSGYWTLNSVAVVDTLLFHLLWDAFINFIFSRSTIRFLSIQDIMCQLQIQQNTFKMGSGVQMGMFLQAANKKRQRPTHAGKGGCGSQWRKYLYE